MIDDNPSVAQRTAADDPTDDPAETPSAPAELRLAARIGLGALLAGVVAVPFVALMILVLGKLERLQRLDQGAADSLNGWALGHDSVVQVLLAVSDILDPFVFRAAVLVAVVLLWRGGARRLAVRAGITMTAGGLLGVLLKHLVQRARPSFPDPVALASSYSFPSGHALNSFLGVGILLTVALPVFRRRGKIVCWLAGGALVLATGLDRIALGVHFVSDVLAGWCIAGALLVGTATAFDAWRGRRSRGSLDPSGSRRLARGMQESVGRR